MTTAKKQPVDQENVSRNAAKSLSEDATHDAVDAAVSAERRDRQMAAGRAVMNRYRKALALLAK